MPKHVGGPLSSEGFKGTNKTATGMEDGFFVIHEHEELGGAKKYILLNYGEAVALRDMLNNWSGKKDWEEPPPHFMFRCPYEEDLKKEKDAHFSTKCLLIRNLTGASMKDCKKFLQECDGDVNAALDELRKHRLA